MSNTEEVQPTAPPCTRCGERRVDKMSEREDVTLWCCKRCGNIFGTLK